MAYELKKPDDDGNGILSLDETVRGVERLQTAISQVGLAEKCIIFLAKLAFFPIGAVGGVVYALPSFLERYLCGQQSPTCGE